MKIQNKIAIVTGASSGLGAAISEALIAEDAIVYGLARNSDALIKIQKNLGNNFTPVILDISEEKAVKHWVAETFSKEKSPDILINNAGTGSFGKIDEMPSEEWYKMINTNLNGMYCITSEVVRLMKPKKESTHIINVGSILGITTRSEGAAYSATKYGISGFSEALFKELREYNIKVSCLNPGSIDTSFFESSGIKSHENMLQAEDIASTLLHILKTPDNMLISEMTVRPLNPKAPDKN
ncbi:short-chain alcohol dehydrogenase [Aequorivita sublithincola DSM 14238]|uniref:Short-chain alcohol dehydrogenase n=1 Tax=Aequorivita sublithincola (strain DSM 14238 / LMG 21431 / ACAM 643 / 9-3) TaxID=746697 RepID=I3YRN6_AEQSU|nr:SDR family NAD(P)-dependent oxidoreductase [Aequorivita sublithincola]AFL79654.1 short-chain alcohol dehydrogenase [Aequorivita sublithincola DSM 14238]